jgi:hypothetical protein
VKTSGLNGHKSLALRPLVRNLGEREAEVLEGLAEGSQVIAYPSDAITDGRTVAVQRVAVTK